MASQPGETQSGERLRALVDVGIALSSELSLDALLQRVVEAAARLTGARYSALGVLDQTGTQLERFLTHGIDAETHAQIGELPRGRGILGVLITDARPLRLHEIAEDPRSVGFPPGHPEMHSFLGVPIILRGVAYGNLYLSEKDGGAEFTDEDQELVALLAAQAAVAIENARLYESATRWLRQLESLTEVGNALASELDLPRLLALIVTRLRELVDARAVLIMVPDGDALRVAAASGEVGNALASELDLPRLLELIVTRLRELVDARAVLIMLPDGDALRVAAANGDVAEDTVGLRFPRGTTKSARVLERRRSERADSLLDDPESNPELARRLQARTGLYVPLLHHDRAVGVLAAYDKRSGDGRFSSDDQRLAETLATRAATAVDLSQRVSRDSLRRVVEAQELERKRLARELHDETGQALTSILLGLRSLDEGPATAQVRELVVETLQDVRRLAVELRPKALDDFGLVPALERLLETFAEQSGMAAELEARIGSERLPPEVETALYRIVQEALTNVVKHAGARHVSVTLTLKATSVVAVVEDDGEGFAPGEPAATSDGGLGIVGMRERVALLGGRLEIESSPGAGTTLVVEVPTR